MQESYTNVSLELHVTLMVLLILLCYPLYNQALNDLLTFKIVLLAFFTLRWLIKLIKTDLLQQLTSTSLLYFKVLGIVLQ